MNEKAEIMNPEAYYDKALKNTLASEIRWATAKRRAPFWGDALRLDDLRSHSDKGDFRENSCDSDKNAGVEAIIASLDRGLEASGNGEWRSLFSEAFAALDDTAKAIAIALANDWRTAVAARMANTNRPHVDRVKESLRVKFAAAHEAWKHRFDD